MRIDDITKIATDAHVRINGINPRLEGMEKRINGAVEHNQRLSRALNEMRDFAVDLMERMSALEARS